MSTTTDPNDPRLGRGPGAGPRGGQNDAYLVMSPEERARGFVRPIRTRYKHADCGARTTMALSIAETYARDPKFYGATYCVGCGSHFPVEQFTWDDDTVVGS